MKVIVVDDDRAMGELVDAALTPLGFDFEIFTRPALALAAVKKGAQLVLADVRMPEMDGVELCRRIHEFRPSVPVILLTGFGSMETAVEAMRAGAYDFLSKPVSLDELEFTVQRAAKLVELSEEVQGLQCASLEDRLIGTSSSFNAVLAKVAKACRTDVPVLLTGETGTGKEVIARELHENSARRRHPFVAVNCSAIPDNLVESELFGHTKGAFTDASSARTGLIAEAGKGTLFLDEIGELPLHVQPKLLRALQERTIRPVGANREVNIECRIVAATNLDLKQAVENGSFRSDLYFRLAVIRVQLPPLRERTVDILPLAQLFARRAAKRLGLPDIGLTPEIAQVLMAYSWPGNVRELENAMERAVALTDSEALCPLDLPEEIIEPTSADCGGLVTLAQLERAHIRRVLSATDGNKKRAAEILGLDRRTLYRKLERD